MEFFLGSWDCFNIQKSINITHYIKWRLKNRGNMIISLDTVKAFDKVWHLLQVKTLGKLGIEEISSL